MIKLTLYHRLKLRAYIWLCTLACMLCTLTSHSEVVIKVVDKKGAPIVDAIVSIPGAPNGDASELAIVDQVNKQFVPRVAVINKGQRVVFPNSDEVRHHVYSFSKAKSFELKLYGGRNSEPVTFNEPGLVVLGCNIHDRMVGYIYIAGDEITAKTDARGVATLSASEEQIKSIGGFFTLWHPELSILEDHRTTLKFPMLGNDNIYLIKVDLKNKKTKDKFKKSFRKGRY